eukprot:gene19357-23145_t
MVVAWVPIMVVAWVPIMVVAWVPIMVVAWMPIKVVAWVPIMVVAWVPIMVIAWLPMVVVVWAEDPLETHNVLPEVSLVPLSHDGGSGQEQNARTSPGSRNEAWGGTTGTSVDADLLQPEDLMGGAETDLGMVTELEASAPGQVVSPRQVKLSPVPPAGAAIKSASTSAEGGRSRSHAKSKYMQDMQASFDRKAKVSSDKGVVTSFVSDAPLLTLGVAPSMTVHPNHLIRQSPCSLPGFVP